MRASIGSKHKSKGSTSKQKSTSSAKKSSKSTGSWIRTILELIFFVGWLICTGVAGYFTGLSPYSEICPPTTSQTKTNVAPQAQAAPVATVKCAAASGDRSAYAELKRQWTCSRAEANYTEVNKLIFPKEGSYEKTKWKSILTVEPKAFFDKYLTQYPGDTRAVQPVVIFSHKPLSTMEEVPDVCKVMDIAIVPDRPGVCVAVTETYHDVASYHMLHADKQPDGTFALTANNLDGRILPDEKAYSAARALLLEYFTHTDYVSSFMKEVPHYDNNRVAVGCVLENLDEVKLFKNSLATGAAVGISHTKFVAFTTVKEVEEAMKGTKVKTIYLPEIAEFGKKGDADVGYKYRRFFLQAWLAFACANGQNKIMWQSPGTIWMDRPDNIVNAHPIVEVLWSYRGRQDKRAAPFFCSFDFFAATYAERPIHLMHELMLHFDLVLAWGSLDAVVAYRLSENNSRYGTTTHIIPPYKVLHTATLGHDPTKIKEAVVSKDHPMAIVIPYEDLSTTETEKLLRDSGLWVLKDS
jgi:hypothetical protein